MNRLIVASLLMTTGLSADEQKPTAESPAPQRIPLWKGHAPVGDGQFEEAEAWITVHRPARRTERRS